MTDDHFDTVLAPVLRELGPHLNGQVVIGGWVPELPPRMGQPGDWAVRPLHTTEVDVLASMPVETNPAAPLISAALALRHGLSRAEGRARARGYLTDFAELISEDCG
ncbi:MAG: hypothetical protein ACYC6F_10445 [Longimicrobiales bacterium]